MADFSRLRRHLMGSQALVHLAVLAVLCLTVLGVVGSSLSARLDDRLNLLARAVAHSVEDENPQPDFSESGFFGGALGDVQEEAALGPESRVEWLDLQGSVLRQGGTMAAGSWPLIPGQSCEVQGVRVFTLLVRAEGKPYGYVRVALGLGPLRAELARLAGALVLGSLAAVGVASWGMGWVTTRALRPVQQSHERLSRFVALASHELRSPLTGIRTNVDLLLRHRDTLQAEEVRTSLEEVQAGARQLGTTLNSLLQLTRAGELGVRQEVDLAPLARQALDPDRPVLQEVLGSEARVQGDPELLAMMVRNLVENALRFTPQGRVTIRFSRTPGQVVMEVEDTGMGIPAPVDRALEPLWRDPRARQLHPEGQGLGLALAATVVHQHGGRLTLASQVDQGTRVTVELPA